MLGNFLTNKKVPISTVPPPADILVCQAGTCRRNGSEAVLLEIEELVNATDKPNCKVKTSGCLGLCSQAPNAIISRRGSGLINTKGKDEEVFTRLNSLQSGQIYHYLFIFFMSTIFIIFIMFYVSNFIIQLSSILFLFVAFILI